MRSTPHTAQGLSHLCLTPEHVLRTSHGQIKVAGLAVDAAVRGLVAADEADAAVRDTQGAAAILYAALTGAGRAPSPRPSTAAPYDGDRVCSPRQVRAGVPVDLDALVSATLGTARHGGGQRRRAGAYAGRAGSAAHLDGRDEPHPGGRTARRSARRRHPAAARRVPISRRTTTRLPRGGGWSAHSSLLVGLVLLVGLGLAGYQLFNSNFAGLTDDPPDPTTSASSPPTSGATKLSIEGATTLDPEPEGDGEENTERADQAFDGNVTTVWNTNIYRQQFGPGGLKKGVGLVLDLGSRKDVSSVTVTAVGAGTDLQVRVANDEGDALADYSKAATSTDIAAARC